MEVKLFDSRVMPTSLESLSPKLSVFHPWNHKSSAAPGILQKSSSSGGAYVKASYSPAQTPKQSIDLVSEKNFLLGGDTRRVNGVNGRSSRFVSRESFLLDAQEDEYEGVLVNPETLPSNPLAFASVLRASLSHWKSKGKKGVWLKLPIGLSELVPIAVQEGFQYHHAEPEYLMLTYWIPKGEPCMLPSNASHQVGVGGFVINEKNEVLVVQEKLCLPRFKGVWKLPTGFILESEEIYSGAVREVKEETGVDTEFVEVIAFRHAQRVAFGKSDLFFICMLRPLSTQIAVDDLEIQSAKWMPLEEFVQQQTVQADGMFRKIIHICIARLTKHYCGLMAHHVVSEFDGKSTSLYYNVVELPDSLCHAD